MDQEKRMTTIEKSNENMTVVRSLSDMPTPKISGMQKLKSIDAGILAPTDFI